MIEPEFQIIDYVHRPIAVLELDELWQPRYVAFNQLLLQLVHLDREQLMGKTAKEAFAGENGSGLHELYAAAFRSKTPTTHEYTLELGGTKRQMRTVFNPVVDPSGAVVRVISCPVDVTAEHALREAAIRTAAFNKEMEGFISLAAHDLRSPMRRVSDITSFLREDLPALSEGNERLLSMLENVASQSLDMISDLVSHAQAAELAGDGEAFESFRLVSICEQVLQTLDPAQTHTWQVTDASIFGERLATQIIVRNLIDNAMKHNVDQALQVTISATAVDEDKFGVVVSDNGSGFSQAGIEQLRSGKLAVGRGFGLAGVMRLITSRGGSISVDEPVQGAGATIRVVMPGTLETEIESD